jgi:hypothetical protein
VSDHHSLEPRPIPLPSPSSLPHVSASGIIIPRRFARNSAGARGLVVDYGVISSANGRVRYGYRGRHWPAFWRRWQSEQLELNQSSLSFQPMNSSLPKPCLTVTGEVLPLVGLRLVRWQLAGQLFRLGCAIGGRHQHTLVKNADWNERYCPHCGWTPDDD